ncbi:MAG: LiaF-related protein [Acidimicrobiia bacterium]|nr:LiaF-related protein [Acidimicrobiia bacterium]
MNEDLFSPVEERSSIPVGQIVTGAVLVVIGVGWLLAAMDVATIPWRALLAAVLVVVGVALAAAASQGAAPGGLMSTGVTLVVILAVLSTVSAAFAVPLRGGFGDRDYSPTTASLSPEYHLIAGQLDLSLGEISFPEGETRIEVGVTFGKLVIEDIPDDVAVSVVASAAAGQIAIFDSKWEGVNVEAETVDDGFETAPRRLVIDARVAFGQIEVSR